jgi:hypothetical protein
MALAWAAESAKPERLSAPPSAPPSALLSSALLSATATALPMARAWFLDRA